MDLAFLLRAERMLERRRDDAIDYGVLVATLGAYQSATPSARAAAGAAGRRIEREADNAPLVELLAGGSDWHEAALAQRGSFNPRLRRETSTPCKLMSPLNLPSHFSLPSTLSG